MSKLDTSFENLKLALFYVGYNKILIIEKRVILASDISYTITLSNNKTEKQGIKFITEKDETFIEVDLISKKKIMKALNIESRYARSFDLIKLNSKVEIKDELIITNKDDITLIELKTTQKKLDNFPSGFFFGATENELTLARRLGTRYKFCFVSLHKQSNQFILLTLEQLEKRIKNKRVQYQIKLM
jgi:hypothetical protein